MSDSLIILGMGINSDGRLNQFSLNNINYACELLRHSEYQYIITSGKHYFNLNFIPPKTEAQALKEYAVAQGIPDSRIITEDKSLDTIGNAYFVDKIIEHMDDIGRLTVVTSDFHMPRASYIFNKMFHARYRLDFSAAKSNLAHDEYTEVEQREGHKVELLKAIYGSIPDGDSAGFRSAIRINHTLYADNLDKIPAIMWHELERIGVTKQDILSKRALLVEC